MQIRRVIFIRPGETEWNRQNRWQGWLRVPLNTHGRAQVEALAGFIRNIGVGALYTSDLQRALETAEIITEHMDIEPILDGRLRERNIGEWQGLTQPELEAWYPEEFAAWVADRENFTIPGGESRHNVRERMQATFDDILVQDKAQTIGIISHTVSIRTLLDNLLPDYDPLGLKLMNSSVTTVRWENEQWTSIALNDIMHLEGLETKFIKELGDRS